MGYLQHGRRHKRGGTDPIDDELPFWTPFTPSIEDGILDDTLSYGFAMVQSATQMATVAVQVRLVVQSEPGGRFENLPGADGESYNAPFAWILNGWAFTSSDPTDAATQWDTPTPAVVDAGGRFHYPNAGAVVIGGGPDCGYPDSGCAGDILFVGGGIYPYQDDSLSSIWPNP